MGQKNSLSKQTLNSAVVLERKTKCSELVDSLYKKLQKEDKEYNSISNIRSQLTTEPQACYSQQLNTCVALYNTTLWNTENSPVGEMIMQTLVAKDLLTHNDLYYNVLFEDSFGTEKMKQTLGIRELAAQCVK